MIKKAILILFPIVALIGIFYYANVTNANPTETINEKKIPLEIKDNTVQCPQCNMFIVGKKYTAQIVTSDNKTHFFDDPGCAVLWLDSHRDYAKDRVFWVYTVDTKKWLHVEDAYFSISDATPMRYGFGAYENKKDGFIDYEEMKLRMLRGENMTNPKIRKKILSSLKEN
ncbi:hypothetical protein ACKGJI_02685 [Sulfurospirillum sp. 1307]|jgi:hypothetical protein